MRLLLLLLIATSASAQTADAPVPNDLDAATLWYAASDRCDAAVPMPHLDLGADVIDSMPEVAAPGGLGPVPIPNLCAEPAPLAVLPDGVRFRVDPLPPSTSDAPGRQLLREQELDRLRQLYPLQVPRSYLDEDRFRQEIGYPVFERIHIEPLVAPSGERP